MINSQLQRYLQKTVAGFLTQTCTIQVEGSAVDQYGAPTHALITVVSDTPCRLIQAGRWISEIAQAAGTETLLDMYRLIVGVDVALGIDQRVTVDGLVYSVVKVENQLTDRPFRSAVLYRRE